MSAADFIDDLIDDSIGPGSSFPERRLYVTEMPGAMYADSGLFRQMQYYSEVYATTYQANHLQAYDDLPIGQTIFDVGSSLALYGLTSAIRDDEVRRAVVVGREANFRTEFGLLRSATSQSQFISNFSDSLTQNIEDTPIDIDEALVRAIDELYGDLPTDWRAQLDEDFLHGFHATDVTIKQYIDSLLMDYHPDRPFDIGILPSL